MHSQPGSIGEWVTSLGPGERLPLLVVALILGIFAIVFIITIVAGTVYKMHKNRLETALKRELLEQGMNAEEIATVIRAKPGKTAGRGQGIGVTRGNSRSRSSRCSAGRGQGIGVTRGGI